MELRCTQQRTIIDYELLFCNCVFQMITTYPVAIQVRWWHQELPDRRERDSQFYSHSRRTLVFIFTSPVVLFRSTCAWSWEFFRWQQVRYSKEFTLLWSYLSSAFSIIFFVRGRYSRLFCKICVSSRLVCRRNKTAVMSCGYEKLSLPTRFSTSLYNAIKCDLGVDLVAICSVLNWKFVT